MAANKFATLLHRNSNRIMVILVYAFLEWVLIALLLLNSLFSCLISKFANYFGLKPPCPLCSNVQHLFEKHRDKSRCSFGDQVCEKHADEISRLSYCWNHHKLAEMRGMCSYCLTTPSFQDDPNGMPRVAFVSFFPQEEYQGGDDILRCFCCSESLKRKHFTPCFLLKPSWNALAIEEMPNNDVPGEFEEMKKLDNPTNHQKETCLEIEDRVDEGAPDEHQVLSDVDSFSFKEASEEDCSKSLPCSLWYEKEEPHMNDKEANSDCADKISCGSSNQSQILDGKMLKGHLAEDNSLDVIDLSCKHCDVCEDHRVFPVEMIDASTNENTKLHILVEEHLRKCHHPDEDFALTSMIEAEISLLEETFIIDDSIRKAAYDEMRSFNMDTHSRRFPVFNSDVRKVQLVGMPCPHTDSIQTDRSLFPIHEDFVVTTMEDANKLTALEDHGKIYGVMSDLAIRKPYISNPSLQVVDEAIISIDENSAEVEKPIKELASLEDNGPTVEAIVIQGANSIPTLLFEAEGDKEKFPETPTSVESLNYTHKKSLCDKQESSLEESLEEKSAEFEEPIKELGSLEDNGPTKAGGTVIHDAHSIPTLQFEAEGDEEKFPETPTSVESLNYMHKKSLCDKQESSLEESLEESVLSETEGGDSAMTIEQLNAALKAERKALHALYVELEEERNASAVAANQTMAMITRLQEEKATMQMEALQYQRMMEEQSEYDQEALQLLNELMIKREKEKQELEKELEMYRKKVLEYEAKERIRAARKFNVEGSSISGSSTSGNAEEDCDEMSMDLNHCLRDDDCASGALRGGSSSNTPTNEVLDLEEMALDCVKHMTSLDDSLAEFEEERLSILDQLRALEEKLLTMGNGEESHGKGKLNEQDPVHDGRESDEQQDLGSHDQNGVANAFDRELNGSHFSGNETMCSMAKRLLPLLDAAETDTEVGVVLQEHLDRGFTKMEFSGSGSISEEDGRKVAIEEEVDHVYERLQALEADREFLKHCVNSIKQGDKGMSLLQEILQHLRDLKNVELRTRSLDEGQ